MYFFTIHVTVVNFNIYMAFYGHTNPHPSLSRKIGTGSPSGKEKKPFPLGENERG